MIHQIIVPCKWANPGNDPKMPRFITAGYVKGLYVYTCNGCGAWGGRGQHYDDGPTPRTGDGPWAESGPNEHYCAACWAVVKDEPIDASFEVVEP